MYALRTTTIWIAQAVILLLAGIASRGWAADDERPKEPPPAASSPATDSPKRQPRRQPRGRSRKGGGRNKAGNSRSGTAASRGAKACERTREAAQRSQGAIGGDGKAVEGKTRRRETSGRETCKRQTRRRETRGGKTPGRQEGRAVGSRPAARPEDPNDRSQGAGTAEGSRIAAVEAGRGVGGSDASCEARRQGGHSGSLATGDFVAFDRSGEHGRPDRRSGRQRIRREYVLGRHRLRRIAQDDEQRLHPDAPVRQREHGLHRRRGRGPVGCERRLGRHRREQSSQLRLVRRRRVQVHRRRQDVDRTWD